jgi:hypothetical protein
MTVSLATATCTINYFITPENGSWDDGMATCMSLVETSTLAHPRSVEENDAVEKMRLSLGKGDKLFIGNHEHDDFDKNRVWQWFDGSNLDDGYTNWHTGEPNNDSKLAKDCGEIGRFGDSTWNDIPCNYQQRSICQVEVCGKTSAPEGFVDPLTVDLEPYVKAEHSVEVRHLKREGGDEAEMALYEHQCEQAIGHDGHYDEATGVWILDNDYDSEPEWRCLMRPFLREQTTRVEEAELSIEAKTVVEEKKALIAVHERLVREAEAEHDEAKCLEEVEQAIARFEECELRVLRTYSKNADSYPTSWVSFLTEKRACPDKFAEETKPCNHYFVW